MSAHSLRPLWKPFQPDNSLHPNAKRSWVVLIDAASVASTSLNLVTFYGAPEGHGGAEKKDFERLLGQPIATFLPKTVATQDIVAHTAAWSSCSSDPLFSTQWTSHQNSSSPPQCSGKVSCSYFALFFWHCEFKVHYMQWPLRIWSKCIWVPCVFSSSPHFSTSCST